MDLSNFDNSMDKVLAVARAHDVSHMLSVAVELDDFPILCALADKYKHISISVGIHPNHETDAEPDASRLSQLALSHPACIAIGETGLDYYRAPDDAVRALQQQRFREHIRAAIASSKPLIIHTRDAAEDTLRIMKEENAQQIGGVMHCFSETKDIAKRAMDLNFYISFSGIITFKNAEILRELACYIPLDRLLIETDSPYLAPAPYRGKQNHPALVKYVALMLADLRKLGYEQIAEMTKNNFSHCFLLIP